MAELKKHERTYQRADEDRPRNGQRYPFAKGPSIGEVLDAYHREHSHRRKAAAYIVTETLNQFMAANLIEENYPMISLEKHHCKVFKAGLLDGTVTRKGRRKPGPVTIARKLSHLHHFIKWAINNEHMETDIMAGLVLPARLVSSAKTIKEAFTDEHLSMIVKALAPYRNHADVMRREWYWVVLLLMHSGCRALEVIQLLRADVRQVDGIWCMDVVWTGEGRQLKNKTSIRKVPLHSGVLAAGFLDWHNQQQGLRLFPTLFPFGATKTSQWFSFLLEELGIKRKELTLHSLRHSVAVALEKNRIHPSLSYRLLGHALPGGVHATTYLHSLSYSVKELSEALEKIHFPS
jgi:integrase